MKNIYDAIGKLSKQDARDLKDVCTMSISCLRDVVEDKEEFERLAPILDEIIFSCKERIKTIAMREIEEE